MTTITAASKRYNLYWTAGKVMETGKNMETIVRGSGGGGATYNGYGGTAPVNITSTTVVHDQIFLVDNSGTEHAFQLQDFNVACRADNQLSVVWAIKEGKQNGPYILVYNHTTRSTFYNDKNLMKLFRYPGWYLMIAMVLCLIMGRASGLFYLLFFLAPIVWFLLAKRQANQFKQTLNPTQFI